MRTNRDAAAVLARLQCAEDVRLLLPALGFERAIAELDRESLQALSVADLVTDAAITRGSGALRALVVTLPHTCDARDTIRTIADRLSRGSPHILWLLIALHPATRTLAVAAWSPRRPWGTGRTAVLMVELDHVVDSDAETICALAAVRDSLDIVAHGRWVEILGREALTQRFYRSLESIVRKMAAGMTGVRSDDDCSELALLHVSRLIFLSFLEAKGWLDGDRAFLSRTFASCMESGGDYEKRVLRPLIFGTLNTTARERSRRARDMGRVPFLNGGLFARTAAEKGNARASMADEHFGELFGDLLSRYRFTAREDSTQWSEAAIDPEMLGKAFESLMVFRSRQHSGAFYTPNSLVENVTATALSHALQRATGLPGDEIVAALQGNQMGEACAGALRHAAADLRVMDPACGSGAFLVHTLEQVATLLRNSGDRRSITDLRRSVVSRSIFGVDINPTAVWLCELRLWLSIVIDTETIDPMAVAPLPNLDHNIRVGDSLSGSTSQLHFTARGRGTPVTVARQRYMRATGRRKQQLAETLNQLERKHALDALAAELTQLNARRKEVICSERSRDLFGERAHQRRLRSTAAGEMKARSLTVRASIRKLQRGGALPFAFSSHFAEVMAQGGFNLILGNPPWVRIERIPEEARRNMRRNFEVFKLATWQPRLAEARPGPGFAPQVDLAALFVERALALSRPDGTIALILPSKLWRTLAGSGVRQLLTQCAEITELQDWSEATPAFDAVVYPSVIIAYRNSIESSPHGQTDTGELLATIRTRSHPLRWSTTMRELPLASEGGSPWLMVPREVRSAFDALSRSGIALGETQLGAPRLGVKCGFNGAFIVKVQRREGNSTLVCSGDVEGKIEPALIRPLLRGEGVQQWRVNGSAEHIIWTHGSDHHALRELPPQARRWFSHWRPALVRRSDLRQSARWWALFRTDGARSDCWRVVWSDIARSPRAAVLPRNSSVVPLNSCYVATFSEPDDAFAMAALLNSPLTAAWLNMLAEQARGGYRRYMAWTLSLLPIPASWPEARAALAEVGRRGYSGETVGSEEMLDLALKAYGLNRATMEPLLTWNAR